MFPTSPAFPNPPASPTAPCITDHTGDILQADVAALVNPVNTVGVMGKGLALQFKSAFPQMYSDYRQACATGALALGRVHVWDAGLQALERHRYVISFPTKSHWRSRSRLADVEAGLVDLAETVRRLEIRSIALPALGCGLGGLDWPVVHRAIHQALSDLREVDVRLYGPSATS
ncbi:macro domain-containing protein [Streptomyces paromomycinus]|uniref:Macro domain-containing protein n=1 Tax=Streptomyces paromomycinus TaxID=92743 RepID=A0A401VTS9_STREY|nr:macro domain-containing protein [Streptomyces paromomycinus]GCD40494.1 hypothetical protein GKJPGBOP_00143 [Streptomyces paromomycinus]